MPCKEIAEYASIGLTMSKTAWKRNVYTLSADKTHINPYTGEGCNYMTEKFVLPPELEKISRFAFRGSYRLQSIEFPDGVREIGLFAFSGCSALKKIELPSSLNILGDGSFFNCLLEEITLNEGLEEIGYNAFRSGAEFDRYTDGVPKDIEIVPIRQGIEDNPRYYCVPQRFTEITIPIP